jgi:hypothetical protein
MDIIDLIKLEVEAMACLAIVNVTYPLETLQFEIAEDDDYIGPEYISKLNRIKEQVSELTCVSIMAQDIKASILAM